MNGKHYKLLTPGPLTTSEAVKQTMLMDWCTWDEDYNGLVQNIRSKLLQLAGCDGLYSAVLMQGSGTFSVESVIGSSIGKADKLLVIANGAYGDRIAKIASVLDINHEVIRFGSAERPESKVIDFFLKEHRDFTHVALVHCETTTGILNPVNEILPVIKKHGKIAIVDAMSSFGGIPIDVQTLDIDVLISSANKCIQGVPGFGFVIAKRSFIESCEGKARSLSLDLFDQYDTMEKNNGKWRFTSPTHVVRAFYQALLELEAEGGVNARHKRYIENQKELVKRMAELGFEAYVPREKQSPIITTFKYPVESDFTFIDFYQALKRGGYVIYPGKLTEIDVFRIGNIGEIYKEDIVELTKVIGEYVRAERNQ